MRGTSSTTYILIILFCLSAAIIGIFIGCDDKKIEAPVLGSAAGSGPVGGGDTQKITLLASPSETVPVPVGEQGTIKVTALIENSIGQPMPDGTAVYWTTDIGTLDSTVTTSSNGSSTVTLTFPKDYTGCTWVVARSGDVEGGIRLCVTMVEATPTPTPTATGTATPTPTATPSRTLTVGAAPSTITLPAPNTSTITACAFTNGIADQNLQVTFTLTSNPAGVGTLNRNSALTDATGCNSGVAPNDVIFTAVSAGTATITATTADGRTATVSILVN